MKKTILTTAILGAMGLLSACNNDSTDSTGNVNSNSDVTGTNDTIVQSPTVTSDGFSKKAFLTYTKLDTGVISNKSLVAKSFSDNSAVALFAKDDAVSGKILVVSMISGQTGQETERFTISGFADQGYQGLNKPTIVKLKDGSYLVGYMGSQNGITQPMVARLVSGQKPVIYPIGGYNGSAITLTTNGIAIFTSWFDDNGSLKAAYFSDVSGLATVNVIDVAENSGGKYHGKSFMQDNSSIVKVIWQDKDASGNTVINYREYDASTGVMSGVKVLSSSSSQLDGFQAMEKSGNVYLSWVNTPDQGSGDVVYYAAQVKDEWSQPVVVSSTSDTNNKGQVSIAVSGKKVGIAWTDLVRPFSSIMYAEGQNGSWSKTTQVYDLGGNYPKLVMDGNGNSVLAFSAYHTYYSTKLSGSTWKTPSKANGLNFGDDIDMTMDVSGRAYLLWASNSYTNSDQVAMQIFK